MFPCEVAFDANAPTKFAFLRLTGLASRSISVKCDLSAFVAFFVLSRLAQTLLLCRRCSRNICVKCSTAEVAFDANAPTKFASALDRAC